MLIAVVLLAACDTGDGKTLKEPTGTRPPPTPSPTTTELPRDGVGTLASAPIDTGLGDLGLDRPGQAEFSLFAPWIDGQPIDRRHTCDGDNISPALSWSPSPDGTVEIAVAVVDESLLDGQRFIHWVIAGIGADEISLIEGQPPIGAIEATNGFGEPGWGGPCPPQGDGPHLYRFTAYALTQQVELVPGTSGEELLDFVQAVALASADITGTYER